MLAARLSRLSVMAALAVLCLVAAACGSGSGSGSAKASGPAADGATDPPTTVGSATNLPGVPTSAASSQDSTVVSQAVAPGSPAGTVHMSFKVGPIVVKPGQNSINYSGGSIPRPTQDGWILRMSPNIRRADGSVPPVDVIHLHHGVWLNLSARDATSPGLPERFFAAGEEKTVEVLPPGYGYRFRTGDRWLLNYMVHNLTPTQDTVFLTYDIDFLPASAPAAKAITPAHPVWMDVRNGEIYPVFDVHKGSGTNGTFTYPDQAVDPYPGAKLNQWTVPTDSVLIGTGGHLHPGGLHDDLWLDRAGRTAHLFESDAHYYEPAGAVSWDVAMSVTNDDYRVALKKGDVLRTTTTYDSKRASWYESMGIMVSWLADAAAPTDPKPAPDPFVTKVDGAGHLTHGHLPENDHHGGGKATLTDLTKALTAPGKSPVDIGGFLYDQGDMSQKGPVPTVRQGQSLTFLNTEADQGNGIWHTITACKEPCNQETGIAYPLADGSIDFDSGQLGTSGPPTAGRDDWKTPTDLPVGTYTYFCRVHPFMRGAFTVIASS